jgi:hypothetical protein
MVSIVRSRIGENCDFKVCSVTHPPAARPTAEPPGVPLLVGVVGHRDLVPDEMPAIRVAAERLLRAIRDAQPDVPIKLLSAQAEGADLLVAEVAHQLGIDIIALLPHTEAQCRADLTSDAARAAFDRTMAGAERLELAPATGASSGDPTKPGDARDRQFERAGDLIALYSSLMIAVWDGLETEHRAGTSRSVKRRRGRAGAVADRPHLQPDGLSFAADNDLIYDIRCSRLRNSVAGTSGAGLSIIGFVTGETAFGSVEHGIPPMLATLLARTAEFNRDAREHGAQIAEHGRPLAWAAPHPVSDALQYLNRLFVTADWLAVHFRHCFTRALAGRFSLWALVAYLLLAFKKSPDGIYGFMSIAGVLLVFALGWALAFWARRRSWDRRYLDYRALAEGLRVDFYWELAGVRAGFDDAFAHEGFLHKYAQLEWMRAAMRCVNLRCALYPRASTPNGFEHALAAWVGDPDRAGDSGQLRYYRRSAVALKRRIAIAELISRVMLIGGLVLAVTLAADVALRLFEQQAVLAPAPRGLMLTALALLTAYTAIFEVYLAEKADRSLIRQYRHMDSLFGFAAHELRSARSMADKLGILRALGHACLAEHAQWILSHRDKRIDGLRW